jgi:hypothetical protein
MRYLGVLAAVAFLLAAAGTALANGVEFPSGFEPEPGGVYLMGTEEGSSWTQRILIWSWATGGSPTQFQFRITSLNPSAPQSFETPKAFQISAYGDGDCTAQWSETHAAYNGVDDAVMWASGPTLPGQGDGNSPVIRLTFDQGTAVTYPNPYKATWSNTPPFVLQMQAYVNGVRKYNNEFYFNGTSWAGGSSVEQPSPAYASGGSGQVGAWTLNQPIPEPVTMAGLVLGLGCLSRYIRKRR